MHSQDRDPLQERKEQLLSAAIDWYRETEREIQQGRMTKDDLSDAEIRLLRTIDNYRLEKSRRRVPSFRARRRFRQGNGGT